MIHLFLQNDWAFTSRFDFVPIAVSTFYGYGVFVPVIFTFLLKCVGSKEVKFADVRIQTGQLIEYNSIFMQIQALVYLCRFRLAEKFSYSTRPETKILIHIHQILHLDHLHLWIFSFHFGSRIHLGHYSQFSKTKLTNLVVCFIPNNNNNNNNTHCFKKQTYFSSYSIY